MSQQVNVSGNSGYAGAGLLFLLFLGLKLGHVIRWSWWWVTAPLWAPVALVVLASLLFVALGRK